MFMNIAIFCVVVLSGAFASIYDLAFQPEVIQSAKRLFDAYRTYTPDRNQALKFWTEYSRHIERIIEHNNGVGYAFSDLHLNDKVMFSSTSPECKLKLSSNSIFPDSLFYITFQSLKLVGSVKQDKVSAVVEYKVPETIFTYHFDLICDVLLASGTLHFKVQNLTVLLDYSAQNSTGCHVDENSNKVDGIELKGFNITNTPEEIISKTEIKFSDVKMRDRPDWSATKLQDSVIGAVLDSNSVQNDVVRMFAMTPPLVDKMFRKLFQTWCTDCSYFNRKSKDCFRCRTFLCHSLVGLPAE